MSVRLQSIWIGLRSSLWFVPALIVTGAVLLAVALVEVDSRLPDVALARFPRLFGAGAEGTRGMLGAIASAMITVAGVVFSITLVALSLASNQYTSRVLRNFMRDRTNQVVLGTFVGIYAYCLVVLRTIRGSSEGDFVPSVAAFGAIVLAFVGIGLLIHFIHHISSAVQAARILGAIRAETAATIERLLPDVLAEGENDEEPQVQSPPCKHVVDADRSGYVQSVDQQRLMSIACRHELVIRLVPATGDFVVADTPLVLVDGIPDAGTATAIRAAFAFGDQATIEQDIEFGIRQIVDIALRALSPAINDPTTAAMCLHHLGALLIQLARRKFPPSTKLQAGRARLISREPGFESLLSAALEEIRLAAGQQTLVLREMVQVLESIGAYAKLSSRTRAVRFQLMKLDYTIGQIADPHARAALTDRMREVLDALGTSDDGAADATDACTGDHEGPLAGSSR